MSEHHTFSVADAIEHGVNKAILLHNFRFWLGVNQRNNACQRDGATWTFLTADRIASAHGYMSRRSVARWLTELCDAGKIIRHQFGKIGNQTYWYTMPDYISKKSKFYPQNPDELNKTAIGQNGHANKNLGQSGQTLGQSGQTLGQSGHSLRSLNKDSLNNTNNTTDVVLDDFEKEASFAQNLKNQIDHVMEQSTTDTIDDCKKRAVDLLPEHWVKKTFSWKGVRDKVEIFDVVDAFLLNVIAQESDARERNMYYVDLSYDKLTAKLNTWVSRYANQRTTDRARAVKFAKKPILSPAEQHRANNPEAFTDGGADDEFAYIENL